MAESRFHIEGPGGREAVRLPSLGAVLSRAINEASRYASQRRVGTWQVSEWDEVLHTVEATTDRAVLIHGAPGEYDRARAIGDELVDQDAQTDATNRALDDDYADEHESGQLRLGAQGDQRPLLPIPDDQIPTVEEHPSV